MKGVINIMVIVLALSVFVDVSEVCAEEIVLTPVPEEIINFGALEILRNTMDPSNVISREGWLVTCGSLGDKVKDYFLIPIYDVNGIVVKYWAIGYYGEGQMKNLEEIITSLWYPYELWEKKESYFDEVIKATSVFDKKDLTYEEYRQVSDMLKEKHKPIQESIDIYRNINTKDYLYATIGAYYEIPPGQSSAETNVPYFVESYWAKYYHVKKKYQTDDIEFVGFVYNSECRIMLKFKVGNNYVYTNSSVDKLYYPTEIIEQDKFEGFDLYRANYDSILFKYKDSKKRIWDSIMEKYFEDKEKYGNLDSNSSYKIIEYQKAIPDIINYIGLLEYNPDYYQHGVFDSHGCSYASAANVMLFFDAFWTLDYSFDWTLYDSPTEYTVENQLYGLDFQWWCHEWLNGLPPEQPPSVICQIMSDFWWYYTGGTVCYFTVDLNPSIWSIVSRIDGVKPVWIGIPQFGDDDDIYQEGDHSAYVIGYNTNLSEIVVFDFNEYTEYDPIWQYHQELNYVDWDDDVDFQVIYVDPDEIGIHCTLDFFEGVAGDYIVELRFRLTEQPDSGFEGFKLYRSLNKSGPWEYREEFDDAPWPDAICYNEPPPTNEHYYYMLQEIGGDSWIFEIHTDGANDDDDYITYCSDDDVEGGEDQALPPEFVGTFPPFVCPNQPSGPPRPDTPTNVSAFDNPDDYGGKINLTWTPNTSPYVIEQNIYRSSANSPYYGSFQLIATLDDDAYTYTDDSVQTNMQYYYVIRSVAQYESYDSRMVKAIATDERPYPPLNFSAQDKPNDQGGSVLTTFEPPYGGEGDVDYYVIYRKIPGEGLSTVIGTVDAVGLGSYSFTDNNAPIGVDYEYWAKSVDFSQLVSYGSAHKIANSVDNIAPSPPTDLTGYYDGQKVVLNWTLSPNDPYYTGIPKPPVQDVLEYNIYRTTDPEIWPDPNTPLAIVDAGIDTYSDSSNPPPDTYYYCIRAKDTSNYSTSSNVIAVDIYFNISSIHDEEFSKIRKTPEVADIGSTMNSPSSTLGSEHQTDVEQNFDYQLSGYFHGILESETKIYPNPASDVVFIEIPEVDTFTFSNLPCTVHIYDLSGRLVYEACVDSGTTIYWDIGNLQNSLLADGIYLVTIENQREQVCKPVLILR